jgi:hypothetical protein
VQFAPGNAAAVDFETPISTAYMLDLLHYIPPTSVASLIRTIASKLAPAGRLLVKKLGHDVRVDEP